MNDKSKIFFWPAIGLIVLIGLIHLIDASDSFEEAAYKGWLFYANAAGSLIAAYGIYRGNRWAWILGFMIAAGSLTAYVASRTIGLPMIPAEPDEWLEPLGVVSLVAEGLFMALFLGNKALGKRA